ncbi:MAG TPA: hypothetical protein VGV07_22405 [Devosia sp.]|jgi:phage terminase Nu1 subunit (DNA packaging protein)|uniref:hypothetical protein n=1 Tax=Devosia sp. TaxID=1871048 RepID=UPI002DDCF3CF|nr:hypothetical protein [Devosia sp.]HEV2518020.1 hypothetical protein [Devosia sp.]
MTSATLSLELKTFARRKWPLENDKSRKRLLAGLLKFTLRRVRSLYEGERTAVPRGDEIVTIEQLIGKRIGAAAEKELTDAKAEYRSLADLAAGLQALVTGPNADFYRPQVDAFRAALLGEGVVDYRGGRRSSAGNQGRAGTG